MNAMLHYAMEKAVILFGDKGDNIFTSACLSEAITKLAGVNGVIDGHIIRCLLVGRRDAEIRTHRPPDHYLFRAYRR